MSVTGPPKPVANGSSAPTGRVSSCSVILMHGTWGRGFFPKDSDAQGRGRTKRWFDKDSDFRKHLEARLKGASLLWPVESFPWSGANSIYTRDQAARCLAEKLRSGLEKDDAAEALIIAHSHGGNVALRALHCLGALASRIKVVTLATPFLTVFERHPRKSRAVIFGRPLPRSCP